MIDLAGTVKEVFCEMKTQGNFLTSLEVRRQKLLGNKRSLWNGKHKSTDEEEKKEIVEDLNLVMTDLKSVEDKIKQVNEKIHKHEMQEVNNDSNNN